MRPEYTESYSGSVFWVRAVEPMKNKRFKEEQILGILMEAEAEIEPKDLCWQHGIAEGAHYLRLSRQLLRDCKCFAVNGSYLKKGVPTGETPWLVFPQFLPRKSNATA